MRDALSDTLFPGTSYLRTRLRYVLFVPWIYRRLESRQRAGANVADAARRDEIGLIGALERSSAEVDGIIGVVARASLVRLPSSVYWNALTTWGIFQHQQSQGWYHSNFATLAGAENVARADDPGVVWSRQPNWHPRLPDASDSFPGAASFALTGEEADFLRGRLEERCSGTLLAWLARNGSDTPADSFWDDPDTLGAPTRTQAWSCWLIRSGFTRLCAMPATGYTWSSTTLVSEFLAPPARGTRCSNPACTVCGRQAEVHCTPKCGSPGSRLPTMRSRVGRPCCGSRYCRVT